MTAGKGEGRTKLPRFHPATSVREFGDGELPFTIADAQCGVAVLGGTGGGKTSGSGRFLALGYLGSAAEMGGIVLCAKPTEKDQWLAWAKETGREKDVIVFDASGEHRFNFLDWEAGQQ